MTNRIRVVVLATNAGGSPDVYLSFVEATDLEYNEGQQYDITLPTPKMKATGYR